VLVLLVLSRRVQQVQVGGEHLRRAGGVSHGETAAGGPDRLPELAGAPSLLLPLRRLSLHRKTGRGKGKSGT
jgi:hypothetical protein